MIPSCFLPTSSGLVQTDSDGDIDVSVEVGSRVCSSVTIEALLVALVDSVREKGKRIPKVTLKVEIFTDKRLILSIVTKISQNLISPAQVLAKISTYVLELYNDIYYSCDVIP